MNIAYAAPVSAQKVSTGMGFSALDAITSASWPVQITLLLLAVLSILSWAIILTKKKNIDSIRAANAGFLDLFWKSSSLDDIFAKIDSHAHSNIARVFRSAYLELRKMADSSLAQGGKDQAPMLSGLDNLERALRKSIDVEITKLETRIGLLATTGSTGPFIGLFGTVWGIMGAFHKIGATGMANLAVVAPGISEALIATAIGLAAAIPATVAYNHFSTVIQREELELNSFASDFLNIAKRNFFKDR
jgi:biopolymer transport protein TolQ